MSDRLSRRRYLAGTGAALTSGALAGCSGGGSNEVDAVDGPAVEDVPTEIDEYLADARLYDGTIVDATGRDEITVAVGAGDAGLAFSPAAVRVDTGTNVVWEWTGSGGTHNVASVDGSDAAFDSGGAVTGAGTTFERTFDAPGVQLYHCTPHQSSGMLAAVEVVEA